MLTTTRDTPQITKQGFINPGSALRTKVAVDNFMNIRLEAERLFLHARIDVVHIKPAGHPVRRTGDSIEAED